MRVLRKSMLKIPGLTINHRIQLRMASKSRACSTIEHTASADPAPVLLERSFVVSNQTRVSFEPQNPSFEKRPQAASNVFIPRVQLTRTCRLSCPLATHS